MLFNSLEYLIFFPVVVALFFAIKTKYRWLLLLLASYYFYGAWNVNFLPLIWISTLVAYISAIQIGRSETQRGRRGWMLVSIVVSLGILFAFKYADFFSNSFTSALATTGVFIDWPTLDLLLPIGISFYTFQTLSYTIDVYRGQRGPERHLGIFALYVSFFPQLVAGPIERSTQLLPQFREAQRFEYDRVMSGLKQMLWGFFKKIVIADRVALAVTQVYSNPGDYGGFAIVLATWLFAIQIYCDFSGYSDIAIGSARVMGFDLMENFHRPYFSKSIGEFWHRWHISLSTWFRDYVYIPLGGNKVGKWRHGINIMIVFLLSGLWHGAAWTFFIWGALHGAYLLIGQYTAKPRSRLAEISGLSSAPKLQKFVKVAITFNLVSFAWIFFRANSLSDAVTLITRMFSGAATIGPAGWALIDAQIAFIAIIALFAYELWERKRHVEPFSLTFKREPWRWVTYSIVFWAVLLVGKFGAQEFIYFAF